MFMLSGGSPVHVSRVRSRRSVVAVIALATVAAVTLPAGATTTTSPSHGKAASTLSLLEVRIAGQSVTAGRITATAVNSSSPHIARLVVTPLAYNLPAVGKHGTIGKQTITPASGSTTVPGAAGSVTLPNGLGSVAGPTFVAEAKDTAAGVLATTRLSTIGKVNLAGVPINLHLVSLDHTARVVSRNATAQKSFSLGGLTLPTLSQLLAALGLDLTGTLDQLTQGKLTQLASLVTTTTSGVIKTANANVDAAQQGVQLAGAAPAATLTTAGDQLTAAQADFTAKTSAFDTAWANAYGGLLAPAKALLDPAPATAGLGGATMTFAQFNDAVLNNPAVLAALQTAFGATETALAAAAGDAVAARDLATAVQTLVDALQNLVDKVLTKVNADGDPIASLGGVKVITRALAASTPKATASVSVASIDVLGQSTQLSSVSAAVAKVGATLAAVLNSVPGVTFTPPGIAVGTPSKSTHTHGRTRFATASLRGLTVTLPTLALAAPALPLALPGGVNSGAGSLVLGETTETAQWTPSVSHTSGSPVPSAGQQLGDTGGRVLLPILATIALGVAVAVRRRWSAA